MVIDGYAFIQYAEPCFTNDLDLWISTNTTNASAVYGALKTFGAPPSGLTEEDFTEEGYFYQMGMPPLRIDIFMRIPDLEFESAWKNRVEVNFDGLLVPFISKEDLIASKLASGRPQDLIDAEKLKQTLDD